MDKDPRQREYPEAYIGLDEASTTERILDRMTDPEHQQKKVWKRDEEKRVERVKSRHSL